MLVVDATKFLAGPFGCLVLQDLGARVVKVDPPGGEEFRTVAAASYCALNRDKDQVCIDLKDAAGRDEFTALVHRADALVENMSHQVVDELGLDVGAFRAGNAGLVHCHIDGWGAGPLEETPGFDPLLQARSGLMVAQGGADSPVIQPMSLHDIGTGTLAALGTLTALYARTHLGEGQDVRVALSRTSVAFQAAEYTNYAGRPAPRVGYVDYVGDGPAHRYVEAADGWLGVGATTEAQRAAWDEIRGVDDVALAGLTVDAVVDSCRAAGIPADRGAVARRRLHRSHVVGERLLPDGRRRRPRRGPRDPGLRRLGRRRAAQRAAMHAAGRDTDAVLTTPRLTAANVNATRWSISARVGCDSCHNASVNRPNTACATIDASSSGSVLPSSASGSRRSAPTDALAKWRPDDSGPALPPFQSTARVVAAMSSSLWESTPSIQLRTCCSGPRAFAIWCSR